ncbi:MAG: hypothetical protein K2X93_20135 [Candidatus Obscuribacterales bacterium]|nr:hypothetical protein [Candidatus Obscuribacterales bacterium]
MMTREISSDFASNQATPQLCLLDLMGSDNEKVSVARSIAGPINVQESRKVLPGTEQVNFDFCNRPIPSPLGPGDEPSGDKAIQGPLPPLGSRHSDGGHGSRTTPATTTPKPADHNSGSVPKPSDRKQEPSPKTLDRNSSPNPKPSDRGPALTPGADAKPGDIGPHRPTTPRAEPLVDKSDRPHGAPMGSEADAVSKAESSLRAKYVEVLSKELTDLAKKGVKPEALMEKVKKVLDLTEKTAKIQQAIFEGDVKGLQKSIDGMSEDDLRVSAEMIRKNLDGLGVCLPIGVVNGQLAIKGPGQKITSFISSSRAGALNLESGEQSDVGKAMKDMVRSLYSAMATPYERHDPTPIRPDHRGK